MKPVEKFWKQVQAKGKSQNVVEFGTRRWEAGKPTHHKPHFANLLGGAPFAYLMCDVMQGEDVDLVCDIHQFPAEMNEKFDTFLAPSVWEHLKKPWVAAEKVYDMLKPGGVFLVTTHQTFPIHGYPHDYFRFSKEALLSCFDSKPWSHLEAESGFECAIVPIQNGMPVWNFEARGHIQSVIYGRK